MKKSTNDLDPVEKTWWLLQRLSYSLTVVIEALEVRHIVREYLQEAVWAHLAAYESLQLLKKSAPKDFFALDRTFDLLSMPFFSALSSLGHNIWTRQYRVDSGIRAVTYKVVQFERGNGRVTAVFATDRAQHAARLAAAWALFLVNAGMDVALLAVLESGVLKIQPEMLKTH
jgi:hypothetical protein